MNQFTILGSLFAVLGWTAAIQASPRNRNQWNPMGRIGSMGLSYRQTRPQTVNGKPRTVNGEPSPPKPVSDLVVQVGLDLVAGEPINHFAKEAVNNETVSF